MSDQNPSLLQIASSVVANQSPRIDLKRGPISTFTYNDTEYEANFYLDYNDGLSEDITKRFYINPAAVLTVVINDSLADWAIDGHLSLNTSMNALEDDFTLNQDKGANEQKANPQHPGLRSYRFRNDGYDTLGIQFYPIGRDAKDNVKIHLASLPRDRWELNYKFSIYNVEDLQNLPGITDTALKIKKLHFWDRRFQQLKDRVISYSTATSKYLPPAQEGETIDIATANDVSRSVPTGKIIQEIIETSGLDLELGIINDKDWDKGATSLFYTAPAQSSAMDVLGYVLDRHVSEEKAELTNNLSAVNGIEQKVETHDFSLLSIVRGTHTRKFGYFTLRPLSKYFQNAGSTFDGPKENQIEHFVMESLAPDKRLQNNPPKSPRGKATPQSVKDVRDIHVVGSSRIMSYSFVDMSATTNADDFKSMPVYSTDISSRSFNVDFVNNKVEEARNFISKKYINELYRKGSDRNNADKFFLTTLHKGKQFDNIKPVFSLYGDSPIARQADGIQKLLKTGMFLNSCINFRAPGATFRETGRFIGIDREPGSSDSNFDNALFGQWFIIKIQHIFIGKNYYNDIVAVKVHRHSPIPKGQEFKNTI